MKYASTRGGSAAATFEDALCQGYAPDGGLYVPADAIPKVSLSTLLEDWSRLTYPELTYEILRIFVSRDEIPDGDLRRICSSALDRFEDPDRAVPVVAVGNVFVAELWHGPTYCFKDLGMRAVINLLSYFCSNRNRAVTVIVSTTGDTGPAAVKAVNDVNNPLLSILVHYPHQQISAFQRRQLTTVRSNQVKVAAFQGGGDDMDRPIKRMMLDAADSSDSSILTGVNSYNIGRPLMQMVHYVWTYLRVVERLRNSAGGDGGGADSDGEPIVVDFVVPTGAMGNVAGGYMAKKLLGIPIGKLVCGTNVNDITHRAISTGKFHKSEAMLSTLSEAINIQIPYNFERLLYYLTDGDAELVRQWMSEVDTKQRLDLPTDWLSRFQTEFGSACVTDEAMCNVMRHLKRDRGYWADPHTCVAFGAAQQLGHYDMLSSSTVVATAGEATALLSTASCCKFEESVTAALGQSGWDKYYEKEFPQGAKRIMERPEREPTLYKAAKGKTLAETQMEWEMIARRLVDEVRSPATPGRRRRDRGE